MVYKKKNILLKRKPQLSKSNKNVRFRQKAKQMAEQHKKQALAEKTFHQEYVGKDGAIEAKVLDYVKDIESNENDEGSAFEELMQTLHTNNIDGTHLSTEMVSKKPDESSNTTELNETANCLITQDLNEASPIVDTFSNHLNYDLPMECVDILWSSSTQSKKFSLSWRNLGTIKLEVSAPEATAMIDPECNNAKETMPATLHSLGIKSAILENISDKFSPLQLEALNILNQYRDFYHPQRPQNDVESLRLAYVVHILNHMLKTRSCILKHNLKISTSEANAATIPDSFRDQGLARAKVLIILPFRKCVFQVVEYMKQLLFGKTTDKCKQDKMINYNRFIDEYTGDRIYFSKTKPKPEDYIETFKGNVDDNFKIGISITKKSLKLYTDFNSSDIIIASPLGLRLGITTDNGEAANYDFLNSIEILVMDQAELFFAQNWENVLFILDHLHLQPQSLNSVNLQRVRPWCLNGLCRFYRQSIILASHELPELRSLFHNKCFNYRGKVHVTNSITQGDIANVFITTPQVFHLIDIPKLEFLHDHRFRYFVREILPQYKKSLFAHCMIYVPSYFDFVRIRNYLKQEAISFAQICEYTKKAKVARARDLFFHSGVHFLLYSERYHFFQRTRVKGIRHLIMFQPPMWPHFYSEMINMMNSSNQNSSDGLDDSMSVTILYTKYDLIQLSAILGSESTAKLMDSNKIIHSFSVK